MASYLEELRSSTKPQLHDPTKTTLRDQIGNIDQLRDILFGTQLREYNARLDQLERSLVALQKTAREQTEDVRQTLTTQLQANIDSVEKKLRSAAVKDEEEKLDLRQQLEAVNKRLTIVDEDLQKTIRNTCQELTDDFDRKLKTFYIKDEEEKFDIRQRIDLLSKRLNSNIEALDEELEKRTSTLHSNLTNTRETLQLEINTLRDQFSEQLEQYVTLLDQAKVSREDMAEILFELGMRLKGTEFVPELRQVVNQDSNEPSLLAGDLGDS
ncbi:MAG: hypothetical protein AAGF24_03795 [Cyanobacteria bacterium P01_H01_bin.121]